LIRTGLLMGADSDGEGPWLSSTYSACQSLSDRSARAGLPFSTGERQDEVGGQTDKAGAWDTVQAEDCDSYKEKESDA